MEGIGFVQAGCLQEGYELVCLDGGKEVITDVRVEWLEESAEVYNFEVADYHTYFVGDGDVLVHNMCTKASGDESNGNIEIPWSSKVVSDASNQLDYGATWVFVDNRSQAEELFLGKYQGKGYINVTGMDAMDTKNLLDNMK